MMDLFLRTSLECSKKITLAYSTSFSLGIKTLDKKFHDSIYAVYGFVRYADEIVDTFHSFNKQELLNRFKNDTYQAIDDRISLNPVLHAFQNVVHSYNIDKEHIEAFFKSMEMDLDKFTYNNEEYKTYIYGSAEVIGLMCLKVFCNSNEDQYNSLENPAKHLGSAFQKVNFLRDLKSDFEERKRVYFPEVDFHAFSQKEKERIEEDIIHDFRLAIKGIKGLPKGSRAGVYLAYIYYVRLLAKIRKKSVSQLKTHRIRIPNYQKVFLLIRCYFLHSLNIIV